MSAPGGWRETELSPSREGGRKSYRGMFVGESTQGVAVKGFFGG